ncbi:MAG TPA: hypothetical protein VFW96_22455 [Thermomicrobiales bacterium]|nr:hypothetical protein [Thermomicrobiales bacterium]
MTDRLQPAPHPPSQLTRAFSERARHHPALLGGRLEALKAARGWDDPALARALGTTTAGLVRLRICLPPRDRADCETLATRCGLDAGALAGLLAVDRPGARGPT